MSETKMVRKNINFPADLLSEISQTCRELKISFSQCIRKAAEEFTAQRAKTRLVRDLQAGYRAKAKLNRLIAEDFKDVDGENI